MHTSRKLKGNFKAYINISKKMVLIGVEIITHVFFWKDEEAKFTAE